LQASGKGDVAELVSKLDDKQMQYILVRIPLNEKSTHIAQVSKSRDVFIAWIGPEVSTLAKGTCVVY